MPRYIQIPPNQDVLVSLARHIWDFAIKHQQRPQVLMSTAGPALSLRRELEKNRPKDLPASLAFLPKIDGINQWLAQTPGLLDFPAANSTISRWEIVYQALDQVPNISSQLGAIGHSGRWNLAKSIVEACDLLSSSNLPLKFDQIQMTDDVVKQAQQYFDEAISNAYPNLARHLVEADGHLVMAFWRNLSSLSDPIPRRSLAYRLRIKDIQAPLIWIESAQASAQEVKMFNDFISEYEQHQPVLKIQLDWELGALWPECLNTEQLNAMKIEQVENLVKRNRKNAQSHHWQLSGPKRFEDVAWIATRKIEEHLIAGRKHVALVAQDRLVARRIRALLARLGPGLSIQDETGWKLATTRAAAAVKSWLEIVRSSQGPSKEQLLAFLKNSMLQVREDVHRLQDIVWLIEQRLMVKGVVGNWSAIIRVFDEDNEAMSEFEEVLEVPRVRTKESQVNRLELNRQCRTLLIQLQNLSRVWKESNSLKRFGGEWAEQLVQDLTSLGMYEGLEADEAGAQLLETLRSMQLLKVTPIAMSAWFTLFDLMMEETSYLEKPMPGNDKITILPLSGIRLRKFDAIVMVGCDDRQLPSFSEPGMFFSRQLMTSLEMRGMQEEFVQQARDLSGLLLSHEYVDFLWQSMGESQSENRPSAWLLRLQKDVDLDKHTSFELPKTIGRLELYEQSVATWNAGQYELPEIISPSAYKLLRDCPYHFYVSRLLGLRAMNDLDAESDSSVIGKLLHKILRYFYHQLKTERALGKPIANLDSYLCERLKVLSQKEFAPLIEQDGRLMSYALDWEKQIPYFIEWQLRRESEGWEFYDAEVKVGFDLDLILPSDIRITIRIEGRADRLDVHGKNGMSVIDYKFQSPSRIKTKSKYIKDDPQLLIYATAVNQKNIVSNKSVSEVQWVALKQSKQETGKGKYQFEFSFDQFDAQMVSLKEDLSRDLSAVWSGEKMIATAPQSICEYCDVRGICRKGMWGVV